MTLNLLTALMLAIAGFTLGMRQILLDPRNTTFPCAPFAVRLAMFIGAGALAYMAVKFASYAPDAPYAGEASGPVAVLAGLLALYFSSMLANLLAQRFPASVWRRINTYDAKVRDAQARRSTVGRMLNAADDELPDLGRDRRRA